MRNSYTSLALGKETGREERRGGKGGREVGGAEREGERQGGRHREGEGGKERRGRTAGNDIKWRIYRVFSATQNTLQFYHTEVRNT